MHIIFVYLIFYTLINIDINIFVIKIISNISNTAAVHGFDGTLY